MCYHTKVRKIYSILEVNMVLKDDAGYQMLLKALLSFKTQEDLDDFLEDIMTRKEIMDMAQRMLVAKMLSEQTVYNKIVEQTGASTATISRVNRSYLYGTGGYKKALDAISDDGEK